MEKDKNIIRKRVNYGGESMLLERSRLREAEDRSDSYT